MRSFTNNDLLVEDLDIDYNTHKKESSKFLNLDDISIDISDINIDSTKLVDNKIDFLRSMHIELNENKFISKDSLYSTGLGSVSYSFADSTLRVEDLSMVSRFNDEEFFKRAKYQVSRTNLEIGKLICSGLDINHFIQSKKLHINLVDVFGLKADIYKDKQYPIEHGKYVKMPQDMILDASQVMSIDSVRTFNSLVEYKELDIKSYEPGYVFLDSFNLNIYGISNDLQKLDSTSVLTARLNAKLMGVSPINMQTDFYMLSPSKKFTIKGHVNKIHFSELNRLTQNLVGITMKSGWGEVHIPLIRGDSSNTSGFIYFGYKKLKVELFNREKAKATKGLTGSMAGLILNDIFIKSNNPGLFGSTRPGEVYFKRDTQKFVVNYIWRSIQSGIMSTMGYNNREQRQEKRTWQKQNRANLKRIQTRSTK